MRFPPREIKRYLSESGNIPNSASVSTNPNDIRLGVSSCLAFDDSSGSVREVDSIWWFLDEYRSHGFILGASHCAKEEFWSSLRENALDLTGERQSRSFRQLVSSAMPLAKRPPKGLNRNCQRHKELLLRVFQPRLSSVRQDTRHPRSIGASPIAANNRLPVCY